MPRKIIGPSAPSIRAPEPASSAGWSVAGSESWAADGPTGDEHTTGGRLPDDGRPAPDAVLALAALGYDDTGWRARWSRATGGLPPVVPPIVAVHPVVAGLVTMVLVAVITLVTLAALSDDHTTGARPSSGLPIATRPAGSAPVTTLGLAGPPGGSAAGSPGGPVGDVVGGTAPARPTSVWVAVTGAIARPGVYELEPGARLSRLVTDAGGLTPAADPDRVNLAAPLRDGERVHVPRRGETVAPVVIAGTDATPPGPPSAGSATRVTPTTSPPLVNLNTATADDLDRLPGVGPATATAILDARRRLGAFASVDDLKQVRGIGPAKFDQLRSLVTV